MANLFASGAVALVLVLFAVALVAMVRGSHAVAGLSFLAASLVIYFRETQLLES